MGEAAHHLRISSDEFPDTIVVPYLVAVYRNLTDEDIYFRKLVKGGLPVINGGFRSAHLMHSMRIGKPVFPFSKFTSNDYIIDLGGFGSYSNIWTALEDTTDEEYKLPYVNVDLNIFYDLLDLQYFLNAKHPKKQLPFFNYPDKDTVSWRMATNWKFKEGTSENKINSANYPHLNLDSLFKSDWADENLVFLSANEVLKEKVNLLGFALIEGTYTFYIGKEPLPGHLLTGPIWTEEDQTTKLRKIPLPSKIGKYQLYAADFFTNSVSIRCGPLQGGLSTFVLGFPD